MLESLDNMILLICISFKRNEEYDLKRHSLNHLFCICRHLHDILKQTNMANMVGLMDPSSIPVGDGNSDYKSLVLATRLHQGSADQILLIPYNSGLVLHAT